MLTVGLANADLSMFSTEQSNLAKLELLRLAFKKGRVFEVCF